MSLQGFNETYYLGVKLKSLQSQSSEWVGKSTADLRVALTNAGFTPESHYMTWGYQENLAPNEYFNAAEYSRAKATLLYNEGLLTHTNTYASIDEAEAAFKAAWSGDVYQHYLQYGSAEGINPSNSFDESSYFASKLALLQADPATQAEWGTKTVVDLQALFKSIGLTALAHYESHEIMRVLLLPMLPQERELLSVGVWVTSTRLRKVWLLAMKLLQARRFCTGDTTRMVMEKKQVQRKMVAFLCRNCLPSLPTSLVLISNNWD